MRSPGPHSSLCTHIPSIHGWWPVSGEILNGTLLLKYWQNITGKSIKVNGVTLVQSWCELRIQSKNYSKVLAFFKLESYSTAAPRGTSKGIYKDTKIWNHLLSHFSCRTLEMMFPYYIKAPSDSLAKPIKQLWKGMYSRLWLSLCIFFFIVQHTRLFR